MLGRQIGASECWIWVILEPIVPWLVNEEVHCDQNKWSHTAAGDETQEGESLGAHRKSIDRLEHPRAGDNEGIQKRELETGVKTNVSDQWLRCQHVEWPDNGRRDEFLDSLSDGAR